ncbi:ABC transporter family protein, partial [Vibrio parahaemolyticus VP2007-007]
ARYSEAANTTHFG